MSLLASVTEEEITTGKQAKRTFDLTTECAVDDGSDEHEICARRADGCNCTLTDPAATTKSLLDPTVSRSPLYHLVDRFKGRLLGNLTGPAALPAATPVAASAQIAWIPLRNARMGANSLTGRSSATRE